MTSLTSVFCGPCGFDGDTKNAKNWCIHCEEGFCIDCEKYHRSMKISRDHQFISIEAYRKMVEVSINFFCEKHDKKLDLYCKRHDMPVCLICVPSEHKACDSTDIISLDDAAKHAKISTAFVDLEKTISASLESVQECVRDQDLAIVITENDSESIKKVVEDTRKTLDQYVDELQQKLFLDLESKHESCKTKYSNVLKELKIAEKDLETIKEHMSQIKEFGTDLQVFLGTRQLIRKIVEKVKAIKDGISSAKNYRIEVKMNPKISSFVNDLKHIGEINIIENNADLQLKDGKMDQAQSKVLNAIQDISLCLQHTFSITSFSGCTILPYDRILTAHYWDSTELTDCNMNGEDMCVFPVSDKPFDLTTIDTQRIAVTYGMKPYIEIINIKKSSVDKQIECENNCWGIAYQDEKLYVIVYYKGIVEMDLDGNTLNTIDIESKNVYYIATSRDFIYYTDNTKDELHCCSMTGEERWVFQDASIVKPTGLIVDNNSNVLVLGYRSNNVSVVQGDGTHCKMLLNADDDLYCPQSMTYDRNKNILFVGTKSGSASTYQVLYV